MEATTPFSAINTTETSNIPVWLRSILRLVTIVMLLTGVSLWVIGLPHLYQIAISPCELDCSNNQLSSTEFASFENYNISAEFYGLVTILMELAVVVPYTLCCLLLLWKLSNNWAAWIASIFFAGSPMIVSSAGYAIQMLGEFGVWIDRILAGLFGPTIILLVFVFPSGRFYPRWIRLPLLTFIVLSTTVDTGSAFYGERPMWSIILSMIWVVFLIIGVISQFFRYRRTASSIERLQIRWVGFGILSYATGAIIYLITFETWAYMPDAPRGFILLFFMPIVLLCTVPFPIIMTIAILRYKLWNIDIIINRTLVYSILMAFTVGIYVLVVGGLSILFNASGGPVFSLLATGIVAISFQTVRETVQRNVNRLMFGQRDEPQAVLIQLADRLRETLRPQELLNTSVETLATTLKLPYVAIQGLDGRLFVEYGTSNTPNETLALIYNAEQIGELIVGQRSPQEKLSSADYRILETVVQQIGAVVYAVRLQSDLQVARERLVIAREEERRRIRRDLHDGLGPALASQTLKLDTAIDLFDTHTVEVRRLLAEVRTQSDELLADIRRLVHDLRPPALDDLGLVGAIQNVIQRTNSSTSNIHLNFTITENIDPVPAAVEVASYRIIMEGITNAIKHARANQCDIRLNFLSEKQELEIKLVDDGIGMPTPIISGIGLQSMRERTEELGGYFCLEENAKGGITITARLPLTKEDA